MISRLVIVDIAPGISPNKSDTDLFISLMNRVDSRRMACAENVHTLRAHLMKEWEAVVPVLFQHSNLLLLQVYFTPMQLSF